MSEDPPKGDKAGGLSRAERQAAALRENLRRRKDQARQRQDDPEPVPGEDAERS